VCGDEKPPVCVVATGRRLLALRPSQGLRPVCRHLCGAPLAPPLWRRSVLQGGLTIEAMLPLVKYLGQVIYSA
jgi:hypothetical protein